MMNEQQLIDSIINFDGDISESVNIIKNTAPEFILERYSTCSIEYLDTFLSIVDIKLPELVNGIKVTYLKYLNKSALFVLWASYIVGKPLEIDNINFKNDIFEVKNQWLMSVVMSMDEVVDSIEGGGFYN